MSLSERDYMRRGKPFRFKRPTVRQQIIYALRKWLKKTFNFD